jgi:hypothetical protein
MFKLVGMADARTQRMVSCPDETSDEPCLVGGSRLRRNSDWRISSQKDLHALSCRSVCRAERAGLLEHRRKRLVHRFLQWQRGPGELLIQALAIQAIPTLQGSLSFQAFHRDMAPTTCHDCHHQQWGGQSRNFASTDSCSSSSCAVVR